MLKVSPASGSSSTSDTIPHSRPTLGNLEGAAVSRVIASGQLAQGPEVSALEKEGARILGHAGAVATGSGSQALLLALKCLGLGNGTRVAIPAFTCSAVLHAVEWAGAEPVLLDVAENELAPFPSILGGLSEPVDAAILVHPWGYPLDASAWKSAVPLLIEDCAQSIGALWDGRPVGGEGDASIISFYATKMLCAGEGGLLSTSSIDTAEEARDLRDYDGKTEHARRFNFKMSDLQAAVARVQLSRLPEFLEKRRRLAQRYDEEVTGLGLRPVETAPEATPSYFRYLCTVPDVSRLLAFCNSHGVHCRRPVPVTLDRLLHQLQLTNTLLAWNRFISLPIYPALSDTEQDRVLEVIAKAAKEGLLD